MPQEIASIFFRINCKQFTISKWNGAESSALGPTQPDTTGPITQPHVSLSSAANSCALACGRGPPAAARRRGGAWRLRCPAEDDGPVVSLLRPRIHSHGPPSAVSTPGARAFGALESVSTSGHHHFRACLNPERYPFQPFRIPQSLAALPSGSIVARFRPSSWIVTIIFCFTIMYPVFFKKKRNLQR